MNPDMMLSMLEMRFGDKEKAHKTWMRFYNYLQEQFDFRADLVEQWLSAVEPINGDSNFVYDQLIVVKNIRCSMACPHHLLPVEMNVHIGYLPNEKLLGLSKFARIAQEFCKPPKTQEEYTALVANTIADKLNSKWVMVMVSGKHSCMRHRGVQSRDSETDTQAIIGDKKSSLKQEMISNVASRSV